MEASNTSNLQRITTLKTLCSIFQALRKHIILQMSHILKTVWSTAKSKAHVSHNRQVSVRRGAAEDPVQAFPSTEAQIYYSEKMTQTRVLNLPSYGVNQWGIKKKKNTITKLLGNSHSCCNCKISKPSVTSRVVTSPLKDKVSVKAQRSSVG